MELTTQEKAKKIKESIDEYDEADGNKGWYRSVRVAFSICFVLWPETTVAEFHEIRDSLRRDKAVVD